MSNTPLVARASRETHPRLMQQARRSRARRSTCAAGLERDASARRPRVFYTRLARRNCLAVRFSFFHQPFPASPSQAYFQPALVRCRRAITAATMGIVASGRFVTQSTPCGVCALMHHLLRGTLCSLM